MALDPDSQRALTEIIDELRELTLVMRQLGRTMSAIGDTEIKTFGKEIKKSTDEVKDLGKEAKKSAGLVDQYGREIKSATRATEEATEATEQDTKATEESTRSKRQLTKEEFVYRRAQRSAFRDLAEEFSTTRGATARLQEGLFSATKSSELMQGAILLAESSLRGLAKATTSMARDIYAGQRGAQVSARALSLLGKELGDMLQGVGLAATAFSFFSLFVPQLRLFGVAIAGVRKGLAFLGAGLAALGIGVKAATELNEIAAEQNDQLMKTYRDLSRSGIGVAGGLNELFDTLQLAGATRDEFEQFAAQLGANSQLLAFLGTTTGDAMRSFAEVAGDLRRSDLGQQLEMLGIQAEEQRELVMGYMTQQARLGRLERINREQLIQGSNRYARELDQLAQLTGASRKEQQDAREALLADERLRAAIVSARLRGDQEELARLEQARDLAAAVKTAGSQDLATAIAQVAATGGALSSDMAVMGEMTGRITEVLAADGDITSKLAMLVGNLEQNQRQLSDTNRFVGTIAGYQINLVQIADIVDRIGPAIKEAQRLGVPLKDILDQQQREREKGDKALQNNIEAARMLDNASRLMSATVNTFNYSADVHRIAAEAFQDAVNVFVNEVGVNQPAGGLASVGGRVPGQTAAPQNPVGTEAERNRERNLQERLENRSGPARATPGDQRGGLLQRGLGAPGSTPNRTSASNRGNTGQSSAVPEYLSSGRFARRPGDTRPGGIYGDEFVTPFQVFKIGDLLDFRGGLTGNRRNFDKLEPWFQESLIGIAFEYFKHKERGMPFESGYRTAEENARLGGAPNSLHLQGMAADLSQQAVSFMKSNSPWGEGGRSILDRFGFKIGPGGAHIDRGGAEAMPRQNWRSARHYKDGGIVGAQSGGVPITVAEGGQNEAVVPLPDGKSIPVSFGDQLGDVVAKSLTQIQQMPPQDIAMRVATAVSSELRQAQSVAQTVTGAMQDPNLGSVGKAVGLVNAELGQAMMAANTISAAAQSPDMKSMAAVLGLINPNLGKAVRAADTVTSDASAIDKALDVLAIVIPKFGLVLGALRTMSGLLPKEPAGLATDTTAALAPEAPDITAPIMRLTTALESLEMPPAPEPVVPARSDADRNIERIMTQQADIMQSQTQKLDEIAAAMRAQVNVSGRILQVSQN